MSVDQVGADIGTGKAVSGMQGKGDVSVDQVGADIGTMRMSNAKNLGCAVSVDQVGADIGTITRTVGRGMIVVSVDQVGADIGTAQSWYRAGLQPCVRRSGWCRHRHLRKGGEGVRGS